MHTEQNDEKYLFDYNNSFSLPVLKAFWIQLTNLTGSSTQ